jgi:hypothetical protein
MVMSEQSKSENFLSDSFISICNMVSVWGGPACVESIYCTTSVILACTVSH